MYDCTDMIDVVGGDESTTLTRTLSGEQILSEMTVSPTGFTIPAHHLQHADGAPAVAPAAKRSRLPTFRAPVRRASSKSVVAAVAAADTATPSQFASPQFVEKYSDRRRRRSAIPSSMDITIGGRHGGGSVKSSSQAPNIKPG